MAIDYTSLKNRAFAPVVHAYSARETIQYALGVGFGFDPMDERQLRFVYEKDLVACPTLAVVLAYPGFWLAQPDTGVDWVRILHGEERVTLHAPLPATGNVTSTHRVTNIIDKGAERGAIVIAEKSLRDTATGKLIATVEHVAFCRGNGGYARSSAESDAGIAPLSATPDRAPDVVCDLPTLKQQALLYRLCADQNPLHVEPKVAREVGFDAPILHGLATFGVAAHAVLRTCCDYDPTRIRSFSTRFSAPVYPGETIRTELWRTPGRVQFRSRVLERDVIVLTHGVADLV
jgi:acyl dehydratase